MKQTPLPSDPNKPRNLSGVQFRYFPPDRSGVHEMQALAPEAPNKNSKTGKGQVVGTLQWDSKSGDVNWVRAHHDYRGLGIATTLWEKANKLSADTGIKAPVHSKHRTDAGEAWAKKVGGTIPKRSPFELP